MLEEQVANNWPGLAKEVEELVKMLRIEDPKVTQSSKKERFREHAVGGMKP